MNADTAYAILENIKEFLDDYADVDNNERPNKAMRLATECEELLTWVEKMP